MRSTLSAAADAATGQENDAGHGSRRRGARGCQRRDLSGGGRSRSASVRTARTPSMPPSCWPAPTPRAGKSRCGSGSPPPPSTTSPTNSRRCSFAQQQILGGNGLHRTTDDVDTDRDHRRRGRSGPRGRPGQTVLRPPGDPTSERPIAPHHRGPRRCHRLPDAPGLHPATAPRMTPTVATRGPRPLAGPRGHPLADPGLLDHPRAGAGIRGTVGERGHPGGPRHPCPARGLPSRVDPRAGPRPPGTPLGRWAHPMRPLGRDLAAAAGLAAAVVVSLVIVRVTASEPEPTPTPARVTTGPRRRTRHRGRRSRRRPAPQQPPPFRQTDPGSSSLRRLAAIRDTGAVQRGTGEPAARPRTPDRAPGADPHRRALP